MNSGPRVAARFVLPRARQAGQGEDAGLMDRPAQASSPGAWMSTSVRSVCAVLIMGGALMAAAASPVPASGGAERVEDDFAGTWVTWWDENGEPSACARMFVVAESSGTLDGMWAAPGWNGLLHGTVDQTRRGLRWQGQWRDQNGSGGFRFVLGAPGTPPDRFEGVYTSGGESEELMWNGARLVEGDIPEVPCAFLGS